MSSDSCKRFATTVFFPFSSSSLKLTTVLCISYVTSTYLLVLSCSSCSITSFFILCFHFLSRSFCAINVFHHASLPRRCATNSIVASCNYPSSFLLRLQNFHWLLSLAIVFVQMSLSLPSFDFLHRTNSTSACFLFQLGIPSFLACSIFFFASRMRAFWLDPLSYICSFLAGCLLLLCCFVSSACSWPFPTVCKLCSLLCTILLFLGSLRARSPATDLLPLYFSLDTCQAHLSKATFACLLCYIRSFRARYSDAMLLLCFSSCSLWSSQPATTFTSLFFFFFDLHLFTSSYRLLFCRVLGSPPSFLLDAPYFIVMGSWVPTLSVVFSGSWVLQSGNVFGYVACVFVFPLFYPQHALHWLVRF